MAWTGRTAGALLSALNLGGVGDMGGRPPGDGPSLSRATRGCLSEVMPCKWVERHPRIFLIGVDAKNFVIGYAPRGHRIGIHAVRIDAHSRVAS